VCSLSNITTFSSKNKILQHFYINKRCFTLVRMFCYCKPKESCYFYIWIIPVQTSFNLSQIFLYVYFNLNYFSFHCFFNYILSLSREIKRIEKAEGGLNQECPKPSCQVRMFMLWFDSIYSHLNRKIIKNMWFSLVWMTLTKIEPN